MCTDADAFPDYHSVRKSNIQFPSLDWSTIENLTESGFTLSTKWSKSKLSQQPDQLLCNLKRLQLRRGFFIASVSNIERISLDSRGKEFFKISGWGYFRDKHIQISNDQEEQNVKKSMKCVQGETKYSTPIITMCPKSCQGPLFSFSKMIISQRKKKSSGHLQTNNIHTKRKYHTDRRS